MKAFIVVVLLAYGGAAVSLLRPFYGLLIYIFFAIVRPEFPLFWSLPERGGNFSRIVALGMLAGWVMVSLLEF